MTTECITMGQIAYEAYAEKADWKSLVSGVTLVPWVTLDPKIQEAWEASASAVWGHARE